MQTHVRQSCQKGPTASIQVQCLRQAFKIGWSKSRRYSSIMRAPIADKQCFAFSLVRVTVTVSSVLRLASQGFCPARARLEMLPNDQLPITVAVTRTVRRGTGVLLLLQEHTRRGSQGKPCQTALSASLPDAAMLPSWSVIIDKMLCWHSMLGSLCGWVGGGAP
jgi:hypothetical protein